MAHDGKFPFLLKMTKCIFFLVGCNSTKTNLLLELKLYCVSKLAVFAIFWMHLCTIRQLLELKYTVVISAQFCISCLRQVHH